MRTVRKPSLSEKEIMRKNRIKLTLIIASLCGTCSSVNTLGQDYSTSGPISSVGRIGDGGVQSSAAEASLARDARPAAFRSNVVADNEMGESYSDTSMSYSSPSMGTSEYVGSYGAAPRSRSVSPSPSSGWFESETLLWWPKSVSGSPLVVSGAPTAIPTNPIAGGPDNPIGNDLFVGMRLNMGVWTDSSQNFGVGARGWGLLSDGTNKTYGNPGVSTGVPFFNTSIGPDSPSPFVYRVNRSDGTGANIGTIQIKNDLDLVAGELYGRALLLREGNSRVDLLGGYTFVRLDSEFGLRTQYTDGITNPIQNGTVVTTQDTFGTKNQFHGGHLGLLNEISKGRFTFSTLGKVALGNMHQSSTISGQSTEVAPPPGPTSTRNEGIFARSPGNIGTLTRNQFTFLPEMGVKMKYKLRGAELGIGYTLLVMPSVAMAGSQVDRNVDVNPTVFGQPVAPAARLVNDTFFLHGLDLGMTFNF